jgi:hypothetical protein
VGGHGPDADFTSAAIITVWTSPVRTNVIFVTHEQMPLELEDVAARRRTGGKAGAADGIGL